MNKETIKIELSRDEQFALLAAVLIILATIEGKDKETFKSIFTKLSEQKN